MFIGSKKQNKKCFCIVVLVSLHKGFAEKTARQRTGLRPADGGGLCTNGF
jgi:hypothetical protein